MWIKSLETAKDIVVAICANKCDSLERKISPQEGKTMAEESGLQYYETSAKTGENVEEMFNKLVDDIIEKDRDSPTTINTSHKVKKKIN